MLQRGKSARLAYHASLGHQLTADRLYLRSNIIDWSQSQVYFHHITFADIHQPPAPTITMSEEHFDRYEHYNFEEKIVRSRNSGR